MLWLSAAVIVSIGYGILAGFHKLVASRKTECERYGHIWPLTAGGLTKPLFVRCTRCGLDAIYLVDPDTLS